MIKLGSTLPGGIPEGLVRDLAPLGRAVRATMPALAQKVLGDPALVDAALRSFDAALRREWPTRRIRALIDKRGGEVVKHSDRDFAPLKKRLDHRDARVRRADQVIPDGRALVEGWSTVATDLITSVRNGIQVGLRRDIVHAVENDWTPDQLAASWRSRKIPLNFGTLEGRTQVIAHHQLRTLQADIQSTRAQAVGVERFFWRTQGDDDVRDAHEDLMDLDFAYSDPPDEGLPGQPVNCRCWAESVISDAFLSELGL